MTDDAPTAAPVDITRLVNEAATKSGVAWVAAPGESAHAVWFTWHDSGDERAPGPVVLVVSGPGEQHLPWLPDEVELTFRSKDSGGRLLTLLASARRLEPGTPHWDAAAAALAATRLNAVDDVLARWADSGTIHELSPHGRPIQAPGGYTTDSGAAPTRPAAGSTAGWRPWHLRGRAAARRNRRT